MRIKMNKKISIGAAVAVGTFAVVVQSQRLLANMAERVFYKGLDVGKSSVTLPQLRSLPISRLKCRKYDAYSVSMKS